MSDSGYKIFYRACLNTFAIHEVLVQKATDKSVWLVILAVFKGQKDVFKAVLRSTMHDKYFETLEAAKSFVAPLLEKETKRIEEKLKDLKRGISFFKLREQKLLDENTILKLI